MGGATSSLTPEDIEELRDPDISGFTPAEIKKLYKRFHHLDRSHSGFITQNEMQLIPELSLNPICNRVIELFDVNQSNQINFRDFVRTLWIFAPKASEELKLKFAFEIFDVDGDGKINESDLYYILNIMVGKQFQSQKLSQIVSTLIQTNSKQNQNFLTFQELTDSIGKQEIIDKMTIQFTFTTL